MEIFKVIMIALIGVVATQVLKSTGSPVAIWVTIATGIIILIISINALSSVFITFNEIVDKTNINSDTYAILLKIVGIGYLTEYSTSLCDELDCKSIGKKVSFAGKISIFVLSIPIIKSLIDVIGLLL